MSELHFDMRNIDELKKQFDPKIVDKSLMRTLDKMQTKASAAVSKDVRSFFNIQAHRIKQDLRLTSFSYYGQPARSLVYAGEKIGLTRFAGTVRKVKVTATSKNGKSFRTTRRAAYHKVKRGGSRLRTQHASGMLAFPAQGRAGNYHFFARISADPKAKLAVMKGPAVAQMVNRHARQVVDAMLQQDMPVEFNRNMSFYLGKQVGLY